MDNTRQQIVDSIKANSNILVTVSTNPSVDELSAALGLAIILNNMDKRTSAVFSGAIPPAISFLEPDKTFENSADSLRDFIIALNKEKADHLRYKVEGDVVKIFITPYKTTLSQKDLEFSQGDYNVELIIALGVKDQDHLDKALEAHGKILHDATVMTVTSGTDKSNLGSIDWHDGEASSLSEMIVGLADGLKGDQPMLDQQIATALLTGIVSATDRFSNDRTTSKAMTMAAQLMAAGANQQLIAAKLEEAHDIGPASLKKDDNDKNADVTTSPSEQSSEQPSGSELTIDRPGRTSEAKTDKEEVTTEPTDSVEPSQSKEEVDQKELENQLATITGVSAGGTLSDIEKELQNGTGITGDQAPAGEPAFIPTPIDTPAAPVEQPTPVAPPPVEEPPVPEVTSEPPQILNDHGGVFSAPSEAPQINSIQNNPNDGEPTVDPFSAPVVAPEQPAIAPEANLGTPEGAALLASEPEPVAPPPQIAPVPPMEPPLQPMTVPELPPLPPLPSDSNLPPLPPPPPPPSFGQDPGPIMPPGAVAGDIFGDSAAMMNPVTPPPAPTEPGQFRIPGSNL